MMTDLKLSACITYVQCVTRVLTNLNLSFTTSSFKFNGCTMFCFSNNGLYFVRVRLVSVKYRVFLFYFIQSEYLWWFQAEMEMQGSNIMPFSFRVQPMQPNLQDRMWYNNAFNSIISVCPEIDTHPYPLVSFEPSVCIFMLIFKFGIV